MDNQYFKVGQNVFHLRLQRHGVFKGYDSLDATECYIEFNTEEDGHTEELRVSTNQIISIQFVIVDRGRIQYGQHIPYFAGILFTSEEEQIFLDQFDSEMFAKYEGLNFLINETRPFDYHSEYIRMCMIENPQLKITTKDIETFISENQLPQPERDVEMVKSLILRVFGKSK